MEVWHLKERDWAKDNEILKVSHAHNAEWMQKMQQDVMDIKDELRTVRTEHTAGSADIREQTLALRAQWDQQVEGFQDKIRAVESGFDRQQEEMRQNTEQRMDDLELLQRTIATTQEQQVRLRSTTEETMQAARTDVQALSAGIAKLERALDNSKIDLSDIRRKQADMDRDSRLQFENAHRVFRVFADALQIKVPFFESSSQSPRRNASPASQSGTRPSSIDDYPYGGSNPWLPGGGDDPSPGLSSSIFR